MLEEPFATVVIFYLFWAPLNCIQGRLVASIIRTISTRVRNKVVTMSIDVSAKFNLFDAGLIIDVTFFRMRETIWHG